MCILLTYTGPDKQTSNQRLRYASLQNPFPCLPLVQCAETPHSAGGRHAQ